MPDWSYRTTLRPMMLSIGAERSRRLAVATLGTLARLPLGLAAIDFLGHMRASTPLARRVGALDLSGPIALGSMIDPTGQALAAFARFGVGLMEVGPVAAVASDAAPRWGVDINARTVTAIGQEMTVDLATTAENLRNVDGTIQVCVRINSNDPTLIRGIVECLEAHAVMFSVDAENEDSARKRIAAAKGSRPVLVRVRAGDHAGNLAHVAVEAGAAGVWLVGDAEQCAVRVRSLRGLLPSGAIIVAGGVVEPADARNLLDAGADVAVVDAGLICSGPGLIKRCNEALLSTIIPTTEPEGLSLDAARRAWFWAFLLGVAMFAGGLLAIVIASGRVVLPYDESMSGLTREQIARINPRLPLFMAHDRVSLAGTMLSIGILYASMAWFGVRRGLHWAQVTVILSAIVGFFTFFFFLAFGYFDPFHAFVTAILTQFTLLCLVTQPSPAQPPVGEWHETAAWRRGQWGQLLFIMIGAALIGAGLTISFIGCTTVFVETDLMFMHTTAAQLRSSFQHLIPLVAHDRASLGGMLIANGVAVWLGAQWGFRAGSRWLWTALACAGNIAFASAVAVHAIVGYHVWLHLAPAILGWVMWNVALALSHGWLTQSATQSRKDVPWSGSSEGT